MARMIPDYIHRDCRSGAERKLFDRFRDELPDDMVVLHSLGIARHARKLKAEIDFVVLSRRGILCIEVKGGRIRQERGAWTFLNRYGVVTTKRESPFEQASSAMYALRRGIREMFGYRSPQDDAVLGYSVIFPDQSFSLKSPEWDLNRLMDEKVMSEPMQDLIEKQFNYSEQELRRVAGKECREMTQARFDHLIQYLRPDFDIIPSISSSIRDTYNDLLRLTEEQYDTLDQLDANERIMITGSAGTGKTLLAVEKVRREARRGRRVIFICFNRLLARHVWQVLKGGPDRDRIQVCTLHSYAMKIIAGAELEKALPAEADSTLFTEKIPELFEQAFLEVFDRAPFDVLIVDEGQDLRTGPYTRMLDWLIEGGLKEGRWIWFEDSQQNIFNPRGGDPESEGPEKHRPAVFHLTRNCRNTMPISLFNSLATGTARQKCLVDSDLKVSPAFYRSDSHQLKLLENITKRLLGGGVDPVDIVLLSPLTTSGSVLQGLDRIAGLLLHPYEVDENRQPGKILRHTTIAKFKGLESKVVIVTDVADLESMKMRSLNYVAFSRPTSCLAVLIHEDAREQYRQLAFKFGMQD